MINLHRLLPLLLLLLFFLLLCLGFFTSLIERCPERKVVKKKITQQL